MCARWGCRAERPADGGDGIRAGARARVGRGREKETDGMTFFMWDAKCLSVSVGGGNCCESEYVVPEDAMCRFCAKGTLSLFAIGES